MTLLFHVPLTVSFCSACTVWFQLVVVKMVKTMTWCAEQTHATAHSSRFISAECPTIANYIKGNARWTTTLLQSLADKQDPIQAYNMTHFNTISVGFMTVVSMAAGTTEHVSDLPLAMGLLRCLCQVWNLSKLTLCVTLTFDPSSLNVCNVLGQTQNWTMCDWVNDLEIENVGW